jgi:hypothetical protein
VKLVFERLSPLLDITKAAREEKKKRKKKKKKRKRGAVEDATLPSSARTVKLETFCITLIQIGMDECACSGPPTFVSKRTRTQRRQRFVDAFKSNKMATPDPVSLQRLSWAPSCQDKRKLLLKKLQEYGPLKRQQIRTEFQQRRINRWKQNIASSRANMAPHRTQ